MAKIVYSLAGEGRGHATRARALIEHLKLAHDVVLITSGDAHRFLAPLYAGSERVRVIEIRGLKFHYTRGRVDLTKTLAAGLGYRLQLAQLLERLEGLLEAERPDLVLTDFEPALPRAAHRLGLPVMSIDHQHMFIYCNLSGLPPALRLYAHAVGLAVRAYGIEPTEAILSSFYTPPLKPGIRHVTQVGALLRPEVTQREAYDGNYLLAYLRPRTPPEVLENLKSTAMEVRIYGLGERPDEGRLRFCPIHERRFLDDLAGATAVVGAAGSQLLGEAVYLGKPMLAIPESRHHEQRINAYYLREMGRGDFVHVEHFTRGRLYTFLGSLDVYRGRAGDVRRYGTPTTLEMIRNRLVCGFGSRARGSNSWAGDREEAGTVTRSASRCRQCSQGVCSAPSEPRQGRWLAEGRLAGR